MIDVCLRVSSHPVYRDLINSPPKNIRYHIPSSTTIKDSRMLKKVKKFLWAYYTKIMPLGIYINTDCDLIHSSSGIMILNKKFWVSDIEHVSAFVNHDIKKLENRTYKKFILKLLSSKNCKKIMPWTFAAKKSMENCFKSNKINKKMEIVYPAFKIRKYKKRKDDKIRLLFIGYKFFEKGGKQLLDVFEILNKKFDIGLTIISNVPEKLKKVYKNVNFVLPNKSIDDLIKNYYSNADIFVLPTYIDTFGMVFLEAMSCQLPIVSTDIFAMPEIVKNGENGFLVHNSFPYFKSNFLHNYSKNDKKLIRILMNDKKFENDLLEKLSILIEEKRLRKKMGICGRRLVEKGKFSIKERNKRLKNIYEEILKL